ncbi:YtxH domain-containing protein [Thalassobacillus sp. C254]|uniref:YtxH domain-containing protein n=1 Tax=Thalassobacillus sp. C254 TaxID=1225341 RepID=UPI0006D1B302|nr:YtxH domain-containing protein [Thalassobacillus sp. C254]
MNTKSIVSGIAAGILMGGAYVLLTAPQSGKELREKAKRKEEWTALNEQTLNKKDEIKEKWNEISTEGKEALSNLSSEMQRTYNRYEEEVKPEVQAIQKEVQEISDTIATLSEKIRKEADGKENK